MSTEKKMANSRNKTAKARAEAMFRKVPEPAPTADDIEMKTTRPSDNNPASKSPPVDVYGAKQAAGAHQDREAAV